MTHTYLVLLVVQTDVESPDYARSVHFGGALGHDAKAYQVGPVREARTYPTGVAWLDELGVVFDRQDFVADGRDNEPRFPRRKDVERYTRPVK